jgi:hypothetical protein
VKRAVCAASHARNGEEEKRGSLETALAHTILLAVPNIAAVPAQILWQLIAQTKRASVARFTCCATRGAKRKQAQGKGDGTHQ